MSRRYDSNQNLNEASSDFSSPDVVESDSLDPMDDKKNQASASGDHKTLTVPTLPQTNPQSKPKKAENENSPERVNPALFEWHSFFEESHTTVLFDENKQPLSFFFIAPQIESTLRRENGDWVFYRRNHFKILASFQTSAHPRYVINADGTLLPIESITMTTFGVSELNGNFDPVPLYQTNARRDPNYRALPPVLQVVPGVPILFTHLHFVRATQNNAKKSFAEKERFRLVLCVDVSCLGENVRICAYCSPGFILKGGSPQGKEKGKKAKNSEKETDGQFHYSPNLTNNQQSTPQSQSQSHSQSHSHSHLPSPVDVPSPTESNATQNSPVNYQPTKRPRLSENTEMSEFDLSINGNSQKKDFSSPLSTPVSDTSVPTDTSKDKIVSIHGRLGVNTDYPEEALHVQGNALVTGTLYHPSDVRVKTAIMRLDTKKQLATIKQLKLYQYKLKAKSLGLSSDDLFQHGVLAQEIEKIMPQAVIRTTGRIDKNGHHVELLAIDKDAIFMENVGATVELSKQFDDLSVKLDTLGSRVEDLQFKPKPKPLKNSFFTQFKRTLSGLSGSNFMKLIALVIVIIASLIGLVIINIFL